MHKELLCLWSLRQRTSTCLVAQRGRIQISGKPQDLPEALTDHYQLSLFSCRRASAQDRNWLSNNTFDSSPTAAMHVLTRPLQSQSRMPHFCYHNQHDLRARHSQKAQIKRNRRLSRDRMRQALSLGSIYHRQVSCIQPRSATATSR